MLILYTRKDFKKAFDGVWHAVLWATMKKYNVSADLIRVIKHLCDKATSAVQVDDKQHQWHQHRDQSEWTEAWDSHNLQVPGLSYNWWGFQAWDTLQYITDNSNIDKAETSLEWQEYFSQLQDTTDALPCHIYLPVCLWIMDPHSRAPKKNTSHGNEVLPQITTHLI